MLSIDGVTYNVKADISRTSEVTASDISGLMLDGSYFADIIGTYLQYDITLKYPLYDQNLYAALYEVLNAPVDGHTFVLPYNGSTVTITGRVEMIADDVLELDGGAVYWRNTTFSIIANHPSRQSTLSEIVERGRTPIPDVASPSLGAIYRYTANGWEIYTPEGQGTLIDKVVSANGQYSAYNDDADGYANVYVQVPNTYSTSDNGKVVSSRQLVAQDTGLYINSNGTHDTTTYSSVRVAVTDASWMDFSTSAASSSATLFSVETSFAINSAMAFVASAAEAAA